MSRAILWIVGIVYVAATVWFGYSLSEQIAELRAKSDRSDQLVEKLADIAGSVVRIAGHIERADRIISRDAGMLETGQVGTGTGGE